MTIRTIIVDDESLAIQGLTLRLEPHDDVEIIDTAQNGREAIRKIKTHKPDLVFLDIQMPGFDGFSVVQGLMDVEPPLFVFVTAYADHAIKAFEARAIDYLLKPVEPQIERSACRGCARSRGTDGRRGTGDDEFRPV
jgi:two-component system, LytTR family, response regulator